MFGQQNLCPPKMWAKLHQKFLAMLLHKTPNQPKFRQNQFKMPEISTIKNLCSPKKWAKVRQKFLMDATHQNQNAKFCGHRLKNAIDIRDRRFVPPENVDQSSPKFFRGCYSTKPLSNPNFVKIG